MAEPRPFGPPPYQWDYGNAPRQEQPWWPQQNFVGQPTVQPQPNPYYDHWTQQLGQTSGGGGKGLTMLLIGAAVLGGAWYFVYGPGAEKGKGGSSSGGGGSSSVPTVYSKGGGRKTWWVVFSDGSVSEERTKSAAADAFEDFRRSGDSPRSTYYGTEAQARRYAEAS